MTSARWKDVEPILHGALARQPHERAVFLAYACAGDPELRFEVEAFLAEDSSRDEFLSTPAAAIVADAIERPSFIGRRLGPYTILAPLGAGGMGEVYRARDRQLDRDVAIKILPPAFTTSVDRLARFEREAKVLAALNHPHVGAIYSLESVDGVPALVLELVDGPTLAERLTNGPIAITEALAIATQIADALEVAHQRGIIHRDLKPANVKSTVNGVVKVLDFGLAKGLEPEDDELPTERPRVTRTPTTSSPGAIMGTAAYMSPEQARGERVDSRTDLFSLGAVLYEMVTGRPAFGGATLPLIINAILTETPPSPRALNPNIAPALDRVVLRLLAKDRDARYPSARDVHADLKQVALGIETRDSAKGHRPSRRHLVRGVAVLTLVIALSAWLAPRAGVTRAPAPPEYTQITHFSDSATSPALSPDGRLLTFIRGESTFEDFGQIYMKPLPDGEPVQLTSDRSAKMNPVFSIDGSRIAYTTVSENFLWDTWIIPLRGRTPARWLTNASGLTWLTDRRVMFSEITAGLHMAVIATDEQRGAARPVYSPMLERGMAHRSYLSPDRSWVLVAEMDAPVWRQCRIVPMGGSSTGRLVGPDGQCTSAAWSRDGTWMYFSSNSGGRFHLWRQRFPDGVPEPVTQGPGEEEGIAVDPDGVSLLTSLGNRQSSIWIHDARGEREISREGYAFVPRIPNSGNSQPFAADSRSLFYLVRQGAVHFEGTGERTGELWATDVATGQSRAVLPGVSVVGYEVSRDGKEIVFAALDERGVSHIWLARFDHTAPPRQLAAFAADSPHFGAGGDIYCRGAESGDSFIYRLRGGLAPVQVVTLPVLFFLGASPDGAWLLARLAASDNSRQVNLAFPASGGSAVRLCDTCEIDWTPNGQSLIVRLSGSDVHSDRTYVAALRSGEMLPRLPAAGIRSQADLASLRITQEVDGLVYPGGAVPLYAVVRSRTERNIYRIPLP